MAVSPNRFKNSKRLQRVYRVLADEQEHSTWEIQIRARTVAAATCVSEIRSCGGEINCRRESTDTGPVWYYQLIKHPPGANRELLT